jgi:hypothetical protein
MPANLDPDMINLSLTNSTIQNLILTPLGDSFVWLGNAKLAVKASNKTQAADESDSSWHA